MKRLAKPRRKRKSVIVTMKYCLDIHEDDLVECDKIGKMFRTWMRDHFSCWNESILQYFLYDNNIQQNRDGDRLALECHLDKIVKDDTIHSKDELDLINESIVDEFDIDEIDYSYKDTSSSESERRPDLKESKLFKRLKRLAKVPNISEPSFSDEICLDYIRKSEYSYLLDEDKYKRAYYNNQGCEGFFSRQIPELDADYPIIFYNEMYPFSKNDSNGNVETILLSWMYDVSGNIMENNTKDKLKIRDTFITKIDNNPKDIKNQVKSHGITLSSGYNICDVYSSYDDAYNDAKNNLKEKNSK